jgi:uncharacterized membrane protein
MMENTKPSSSANLAFKWAVISLIASVIFTYAWQLLNINPTSKVTYLGFIPFIAFLFLTQKEYRDQLGGFATFGQEFVAGLLFAVFAGILGAIFIYVYYTWLSPQVYQLILDSQRSAMEAKNLSSDQVDRAMEIMNKYGTIITFVSALIMTPIIGAIISLIGAAIFKKERTLADIERDASDPTV